MLSALPASGVTPPVRIESSSPSVLEGQTLDLNCVIVGPAGAKVTWYKRGGSLPANHQVWSLVMLVASGGDWGQLPWLALLLATSGSLTSLAWL